MNRERLDNFIQKRVRARRLGFNLWRSQNFELPESIILNGTRVSVQLPNEKGVRVAFMELLIADCYGLEQAVLPVRTVLDIGANVGLFALAARNAFPEAVIHSYEPNLQLEPYLKQQAHVAGFGNGLLSVVR